MVSPLVEFHLTTKIPLLNVWQRMHWRKRKRYQETLAWEIRAVLPYPLPGVLTRCLVVILRRSRPPLPDWDGLGAAPKALMDCLVVPSKRNPHGLGLIADDNPACVGMLVTLPAPLKAMQHRTTVQIYEDTDETARHVSDLVFKQIQSTRPK